MARAGGRLIRIARRAPGTGQADGDAQFALLPSAMLLIDGTGVIHHCNGGAETLLNRARTQIVGRPVATMIGHPLTRLAPDQPYVAYDLDLLLPGERGFRADLTVAPLPDREGWRAVSIHGRASHDLAARRGDRTGRTLPASAAAAMLAHEVKNPLSGIRGAAQLLEAGLPAEQAELTRLIRDEVDRIAGLIDRMEGLTDTVPRPREAVNIHAVLGHVRDLAGAGAAAGMTIREVYDPSLPDVLASRDALVQVLLNLVRNAAEAAGPPGTITLRTAYRHGFSVAPLDGAPPLALPIEVSVIDDGPGAPAELVDHLFDAFVTGRRNGTGLGLALVDKLVSEMGGIVEYAREGTPRQTVLRLLLPRVPR